MAPRLEDQLARTMVGNQSMVVNARGEPVRPATAADKAGMPYVYPAHAEKAAQSSRHRINMDTGRAQYSPLLHAQDLYGRYKSSRTPAAAVGDVADDAAKKGLGARVKGSPLTKGMGGAFANAMLQPVVDEVAEEDSFLNDFLSGATAGGSAGIMLGPKGALIGGGVMGLLNAVTGGNAMEAVDNIPIISTLFGSGEGADPQQDWLVQQTGLPKEELDQRMSGVEFLTSMGVPPAEAWATAFAGTSAAGLMGGGATGSPDQQMLEAQAMQTMVAPYTQAMLDHAATVSDPGLRAAYQMEAGSLASRAALAPYYAEALQGGAAGGDFASLLGVPQ